MHLFYAKYTANTFTHACTYRYPAIVYLKSSQVKSHLFI